MRRRAFYASPCQATAPSLERFTHCAVSAVQLRPEVELTPSKVRKSNPCFVDFRCLFKTILGSKMEAKMRSTSCQNRAWAPSKTLLEPGCRWKPFWPPFWFIFGPLEPLKFMLSLQRGAIFEENSMTRPGLQNQAQKAPKIEAKSLPGSFKKASKRVSKKASMLDPI